MPLAIKIRPMQRFGRLRIVRELGGLPRKFECICDCGKFKNIFLCNLRDKPGRVATISCGCFRAEVTAERNATHRLSHLPEYSIWLGIRKRCFNDNCKCYKNYGGRGITISERWSSFSVFYSDMGPRPSNAHTIERKRTDGNYETDNCVWATRKDQNRNTRSNHQITINGITKCLSEWDEHFSVLYGKKIGYFKNVFHRHGIERAVKDVSK